MSSSDSNPNPRVVVGSCRFFDWMEGEEDLLVHVPKEGTDETYLKVATLHCSRDALVKASDVQQRPLTSKLNLPCGELGPFPELPPGTTPPPPLPATHDPDEIPMYHICKIIEPTTPDAERFFLAFTIPQRDEETKEEPQVFEQVVRSTTGRGGVFKTTYETYIARTDEQDEEDLRALDPDMDAFLEDAEDVLDVADDDPAKANWEIEYETDWGGIGLRVGVAAGVIILAIVGFLAWRRRRAEKEQEAAQEEQEQALLEQI